MSYCNFCNELPSDTTNPNKNYHDLEYGFPVRSDEELFERLILEINQAGLSWTTILKRREGFKNAFVQYDIQKVASFNEEDIERLMLDAAIIRHRKKIEAAIYNANQILVLQDNFGSFQQWLDNQKGLDLEQWIKLFKRHFKFVGKEIVNEFLMSIGLLPGAHQKDCWVYQKTVK